MSDNVSVIDAIKLVAKATREDTNKVVDMVKGALHPEQIDDMRLMLSRAREGSLAATAQAGSAATSSAAAPLWSAILLCADVLRRGPTRPPLSFKGCRPSEREYPPLSATTGPGR